MKVVAVLGTVLVVVLAVTELEHLLSLPYIRNEPIIACPGIGPVNQWGFRDAGITKLGQVLDQAVGAGKNRTTFRAWFKSYLREDLQDSNQEADLCFDALRKWANRYSTTPSGDD